MDHKMTSSVSEIVDRMKSVIGVQTDKEVSEYFGLARGAAAVWKNRGTVPLDELTKLATGHGVSLDWLILGRGSHTTVSPGDSQSSPAPASTDLAECIAVPVASLSSWLGGETGEHWGLSRTWMDAEGLTPGDTMLVRVEGDSMTGTIEHGQLVVVDMARRDGDGLYLVRFGEAVRIRRLQRLASGDTRVSSDNKAYQAEVFPEHAQGRLEILGYCHAVLARLR